MKYLVYVSSAVSLMSPEELSTLLQVSRRNNERDGITGMLLYKGGTFIQAIEGSEEAVATLYTRVLKDPRHTHIIKLLESTTEERMFPNWSMGFRNADKLSEEDQTAITSFLDASSLPEQFVDHPPKALKLLHSFRKTMQNVL